MTPIRSNPDGHDDVTAGLESDTALRRRSSLAGRAVAVRARSRDGLDGRSRQRSVVEDEDGLNTVGADDADAAHGFQAVGEPDDFELRPAEAAPL